MKKYTCKKTKEEILEIIVKEYESASKDFALAVNNKLKFSEKSEQFGSYRQMCKLLEKLEINEESQKGE